MSLKVPQRFITDFENFTWGEDWRAVRIIKEKRTNGEYYFAWIVRYYGEKENTYDYDIANSLEDYAWIGRNEKFVGKRMHDTDPDSKTFGKRIYSEAITEIITEQNRKGQPVEREILIEGKTIYEYTLPVNVENTKKLKTLQGMIALNQETEFLFVYGAKPPHHLPPETFWNTSVADYLQSLESIKVKNHGKKV